MMKTLPLYLFVFVSSLAVSHSVYYFVLMPKRMATHFGGSGLPNGWASREAFFAGAAAVLVLDLVIFIGIPRILKRSRAGNRGPQSRMLRTAREGTDGFYSWLSSRMAWFGTANLLFGIAVMHSVFMANLRPARNLNNVVFLSIIAVYFVFVIIWLFTFFKTLLVVPGGRGQE